jgi:hypothetical protein
MIVRTLLYVASALFLVTIAIGILNGLNVVEFDRNATLTHVHSGTVGWVSLGLIAASFWLFRSGNRLLAWSMAGLVAVYILAFYTGNFAFRAISGTALLIAIVWLVIWAWQGFAAARSLPALAVALGLTTFGYGAIIGTLLQVQMASGTVLFPPGADVIGAHAGTMVFSYLILMGMGLVEWRVKGTAGLPIAGVVQIVALFLGGALLASVSLFAPDQLQAMGGVYLLLELVAVVLFAVRILPAALRVDLAGSAAARHLGTSAVFVVVATLIFLYVVMQFIADPTVDFASLRGILVASDHSAFIGVVSNLVFALALTITADRRDGGAAGEWAAWGLMNLGLVVFAAGLITDTAIFRQIGAPSMGVGLLVGLGLIALRLRASDLRHAEVAA